METCQPGSDTAEDRPGASCHKDANLIQESVYSGYAKHHGLKILTVMSLNGLIGALYGAINTRENDIGTINLSNLNIDMMLLQPEVMQARQNGEDMLYYSIYGNAIFPLLNCITSCHRQPIQGKLTDREEEEMLRCVWFALQQNGHVKRLLIYFTYWNQNTINIY